MISLRTLLASASILAAATAMAQAPYKIIMPTGPEYEGATVVLYDFDTKAPIDSVVVKDKCAVFTGEVDEPFAAMVEGAGVDCPFILEQGTFAITHRGHPHAVGSMLNDRYNELADATMQCLQSLAATDDPATAKATRQRILDLSIQAMDEDMDPSLNYLILACNLMRNLQIDHQELLNIVSCHPELNDYKQVQAALATHNNDKNLKTENNNMNRLTIVTAMALTAAAALGRNGIEILYPAAPSDATVDTYFGKSVADPFRPLENDTAAATANWVEAENALTNAYLLQIPFRQQVKERLTQLNNYKKHGLPALENDGNYYVYENDGLRNQSVLYRMKRPGEPMEVFLDPNTLSDDGTVALTGVYMSPSGKYTAYTISRSGSDWTEIYVMETATKKLLADHIEWAKFTGAAWQGDEGFYYSAYPAPEAGKEFSNANEGHKVYFHRIGAPQSQDELTYEVDDPLVFCQVGVSDDGTALFVFEGGQGFGNAVKVKDLRKAGAEWQTIEPTQDYSIDVIDVINGAIYAATTIDAPLGRIVAIPLDKAANRKAWKEIVKEQANVLVGAQMASDKIIATYDQDAANRAYLLKLNGKRIREIELPTYGVVGFSSSKKSPEVYYAFASFTYPSTQYRYDVNTGKTELYQTSEVAGLNSDDYVTEQVFYPSADGTKIPMFITYKKGLQRDGKNPVYLYGYGGFNITLNPGFSANRLLWLENGGIYAQANLRGGNEYGEKWHQQGTKLNKLNVFNDFIAAAEYMIAEGWTSKEYMTIEGGSNGGLLVGACVNMRPDLFKVAIPRVGVMDMMRYHLFTIGWNWAPDYGTSADSEEMASYLLGYSPIHNVKNDGTPYPAILVTTADHDDRVVPAHSFKYAATLQASDTGSAPKLIRIDSKAGHGGGKPISKVIDEYADLYSFIFYNLGITPKAE